MQEAIRKADVLIEALPYIRSFRDKIVVIKLGGSAMEDDKELDGLLQDVVFMSEVRMKPVLVHGGGRAISEEMRRRGLEPAFVQGHRVTDAETQEVVVVVLGRRVNADIARRVAAVGARPVCLWQGMDEGPPLLRARRKTVPGTGPGGAPEEIDLGFVGVMESVDSDRILPICAEERVPVIAPLAAGPGGETLNINADLVASFVAGALQAEKLVFLSDTHGVLRDPGDESSFAPTLTENELNALIEKGAIDGGMLPKVEGCVKALDRGVKKAHIIDGRIPHSLLLEIFTRRGIGTQVVR